MSTSKSSPPRRNRLSLLSLHSIPSFHLEPRSRSPPVKPEAADSQPQTPDSQPDRGPVLKSIRRRSASFLATLMPILNSPPADNTSSSPPAERKSLPDSGTMLPELFPSGERDSTSSPDEGMIGLGISTPPDHPPPVPPTEPHQGQPEQPGSPERPPAVLHKHRKVVSLAGPSQQPGPPLSEARSSTFPTELQISKTPASPQRLRDSQERSRGKSPQPSSIARDLQALLQPNRRLSPSPEPRGRSTSAQPTTKRSSVPDGQRVVSSPAPAARPSSSHSSDDNHTPGDHAESRGRLRKSWLGGGRSRSNSHDMGAAAESEAWIISPDSQIEYHVTPLIHGEKVPELWNEAGSVYVHLHPKGSGMGPSFRVPLETIASSVVFNDLIQTELSSPTSTRGSSRSFGDQLSVHDAARIAISPPDSPPLLGWEARLYIPTGAAPAGQGDQPAQPAQPASPDFDRLVALRNLFAFLTRQPLIGTKASPTAFSTFLQVSALLREFEFTSFDGVSFGEEADVSFTSFIEQLALADVRNSREKTIEALILGEQMRSWDLYNEAFTHAVGKYQAIMGLKSQLFGTLSVSTRQRLERAHLDLQGRQHNVNLRLEDFDFPSLFAGVASSTSTPAYRAVRFKNWRAAFARMRSFMLGYYKNLYGNWPPKARSKKNPFSEGGLNRMVLRALYSDLCSLYDLLVNREEVTRRVIDQAPQYADEAAAAAGGDGPHLSALRQVLSEFDSSSPPVLPPVPYDIPKVPTMASVLATYDDMAPKDQARFDKRLQPHELLLVLHKSYNFDTDSLNTPFLAEFKEFDLRESRGRSAGEMLDHRMGTWLFLYVVLQSLPMLIVDAPGLRFTDGVEYFLCEAPQGNLPWMEDAGEVRKAWYQVPGQGIVELSADVVMFSVEATYYRSHCWLAAKRWEAGVGSGPAALPPAAAPPPALDPPVFQNSDPFGGPAAAGGGGGGGGVSGLPAEGERRGSSPPGRASIGGGLRPRNSSIAGGDRAYRASVLAIGLEPIPVPDGAPVPADRRATRIFSGPAGAGGGGGELAPPAAALARPHSVVVPRSRSAGNLDRLLGPESPPADPAKDRQGSAGGGSTFDDILKDLDNQKKPKKKFGF